MVFSSLLFLFFFLPFTLFFYFISPRKCKNVVLLLVSLVFYAWGEPVYIVLMIFSAFVDYFHGLFIHKYRLSQPLKAKIFLVSSLIINIGLLSFFKYADFLIVNLNSLIGTKIAPLELPLPIGISFYTFQIMSYSIDIYRGRLIPQKNPLDFAMYVSFFPQLVAGPIVRYESMAEDLHFRRWNAAQFADGVKIFIIGLGKKVLLANNIGLLWSNIQGQGVNDLPLLTAWLGIIAFAFQIYFDFSGYSDMAVGLGRMFGFNFPRNFHYPYISKSVTEFWRRWHMTLGSWFRDYVYFPLGGSKQGKMKTYRNLIIVWSLTGLWHGASWNFALWGIYFGLMIAIEKAGLLKMMSKIHPVFQHLYLIFAILIGWVLFEFDDYATGLTYLKIMFGFSGNSLLDTHFLYYLYTNFILIIMVVIGSTPAFMNVYQKYSKNRLVDTVVLPVFYLTILFLSTAYLVDESYNPFLYFRF
ncbi:MBOAT family O-acyltransferase [Pseudoneobacillus sp. C159]